MFLKFKGVFFSNFRKFLVFLYFCSLLISAAIQKHTDNWVVILSTSRFYTNYRHSSNALLVYRIVRRLRVPDNQIILMMADNVACDPRNPLPGSVFSANLRQNLYEKNIDVDYQGCEVTEESFRSVLTGRHPSFIPRKKRLLSDSHSNVLVYLTGHSGNGFLKFHDFQELTSVGLGYTISHMYMQKRYNRLLLIADTCQAETLFANINTPNTIAIGSSRWNENSYAYKSHSSIGAFLVDRFTYYMSRHLDHVSWNDTSTTLEDMIRSIPTEKLNAHLSISYKLPGNTTLRDIPITDFFGMTSTLDALQSYNQPPFQKNFPLRFEP